MSEPKQFSGDLVGFGKTYISTTKTNKTKHAFLANSDKIKELMGQLEKHINTGARIEFFVGKTTPQNGGPAYDSTFVVIKETSANKTAAAPGGQFVPVAHGTVGTQAGE